MTNGHVNTGIFWRYCGEGFTPLKYSEYSNKASHTNF